MVEKKHKEYGRSSVSSGYYLFSVVIKSNSFSCCQIDKQPEEEPEILTQNGSITIKNIISLILTSDL